MREWLVLGLVLAAGAGAWGQEAEESETAAAATERAAMERIDGLLSQARFFFLASVDGDQPKLRPLGAHHLVDGKVWLGVGEFKEVYRQLAANPKCEVVALMPDGGTWLRWTGRAVFAEGAERERLEEVFLEAMPGLRGIYDKSPGKRMMCFTLAEGRAELIRMMPPGEVFWGGDESTKGRNDEGPQRRSDEGRKGEGDETTNRRNDEGQEGPNEGGTKR